MSSVAAITSIVAGILGIFGTLIGIFVWLLKISRRFERLERHDQNDFAARCVLLEGVHASLNGLHQLGANGKVTEAEKDLREYMYKNKI